MDVLRIFRVNPRLRFSAAGRALIAVITVNVMLLSATWAIDHWPLSRLMVEMEEVRGDLERVTALRRDLRKTRLSLLETQLGEAAYSRQGVVESLAAVAEEALIDVQAELSQRAFMGPLTRGVDAWLNDVRRALLGQPGAPSYRELRADHEKLDALCEGLISATVARGNALQGREDALFRLRDALHLSGAVFLGLAVLAVAAARRDREQSEARYLALEEGAEGLRRMAAGVAHEVNNQLAIQHNALELLRRASEGRDMTDLLRMLSESLTQVEALTADLTAFGTSGYGARELVDAERLVRAVAEHFAPDVEVRPSSELKIVCDRSALSRALLNIFKNGVEAGGPVRVELAAVKGGVSIRCLDSGPGLSREAEANAGKPFFTTKARGTGLGLAIVERTAQLHGGRFVLKNAPSKGALAELWLPALPPDEGSRDRSQRSRAG